MTQVLLDLEVFGDAARLGPIRGTLEFVPIALPGYDTSLLPSPLRGKVGDTVEIPWNDGNWCWRASENTYPQGLQRYVHIPDSSSVILYSDLQDIDPDTLDELPNAKRVWTALDEDIAQAQQDAQNAVNDATAALQAAQEAADSGIVLRIDSSRGTAFKNSAISTVLSVSVFKAGDQITTYEALIERFGPTAYLEWWWRRIDDSDFGVILSSDDRLSNYGFNLTITPDDVDEQTVFQCFLNT